MRLMIKPLVVELLVKLLAMRLIMKPLVVKLLVKLLTRVKQLVVEREVAVADAK